MREVYSVRLHPTVYGQACVAAAAAGLRFAPFVETAVVRYLRARGEACSPAALACERAVCGRAEPCRLELARRRRVQTAVRLHEEVFVAAAVYGGRFGVGLAAVLETAIVELLGSLGVQISGHRAGVAPLAPAEPWRVPPPASAQRLREHAARTATVRRVAAPAPRRPRR